MLSDCCSNRADYSQLLADLQYEGGVGGVLGEKVVLFGEIIYAEHLMLYYINHLEGKPKDYTIFLLTIIIAN